MNKQQATPSSQINCINIDKDLYQTHHQHHTEHITANHWQRLITDTYFDLSTKFKQRTQFKGQLQNCKLKSMGISNYQAHSVSYQRSSDHLIKNSESILITFPMKGSVHFEQQKRNLICYPGQFFIELSQQPYRFYHKEFAHLYVMKVPLSSFNQHQSLIERHFAKPIDTQNGAGRLLYHQLLYSIQLASQLQLSEKEQVILEQQLLDLIIHTITGLDWSVIDGKSAFQSAHLKRIEQFVRTNLSESDLSAKKVAQACHISERYLYLLFSSLSMSFAQWVKTIRLDVAHDILKKGSYKSIADVGYQVGFVDASYFSRIYKKHFGYSPKETQ